MRRIRIAFPSGALTSFTLTTTAASGTYPFTVGVGIAKGDAPSNITTDLTNAQVVVKRRWSDGSVKHAIISGRATLTQNVPLTVSVSTGVQSPSGADLTSDDIVTSAPTASIQCGTIGTISLADLVSNPSGPIRTWISGPEMVECHYRSDVGSGLSAWFYVRLYVDGRIYVRCIVENGYIDLTNATQTYNPVVTVDGTIVYSSGGTGLPHYANTRWYADGWIGGDPQITPAHDVEYVRNSKLVPNYGWTQPTGTYLDLFSQTYTPMGHGSQEVAMGAAGFSDGIGILPTWDALYCTTADPRAWREMLANTSYLSSYGIIWRDSATQLPFAPSDFPTTVIEGGTFAIYRGALAFELNHMPSPGYAAYLFTGDYWYYETMLHIASTTYGCMVASKGSGTSRKLLAEVRGNAWMLRSIGQLCALSPDGDTLAADFEELLDNNYAYWVSVSQTAGINQLGCLYQYTMGTDYPGSCRPWMTNFWVLTNGHLVDIEATTSANLTDTLNWMYKWIVGLFGQNAVPTEFDWERAGGWNGIGIGTTNDTDPTTWFDSWGQVFSYSFGVDNNVVGNSILTETGGAGTPQNADRSHRWGVAMTALAFAIDHGFPGAQEGFNRLIGADNWGVMRDCGFDDTPTWGVIPRNTTVAQL